MIDRLLQIEIENFRAYGGGTRTVDLDADVVLIHGRNGSGKTSLLSAIEYAVTGHVDHLRPFKKDYARVISHIGGDAPARVRLTTRSTTGDPHTVERRDGGVVETPHPKRTRDAFLDRSYLSQAHLARLLHLYQETGKRSDESDPPIIRFIRDLLDLQSLENIEEGLDVAGNVTRLRKAYDGFKVLEDSQPALARAASEAAADVERTRAAEQQLRSEFDALVRDAEWDVPQEPEAVAEFFTERLASYKAEGLTLNAWIRTLEGSSRTSPAPVVPPDVDDEAVSLAAATADGAIRRATTILEGAEPMPSEEQPTLTATTAALRDRLERTHATLESQRVDTSRRIQSSAEAATSLEALRLRAAEIETELVPLTDLGSSLPGELASLRSALESVLSHIDSEQCPVCDRDYSEVGGGLRSHLAGHLERLGTQTAQLQEQITARTRLLGEKGTVEKKIVEAVATGQPARVEALREREGELAKIPAYLDSAGIAIRSLEAAVTQKGRIEQARRALSAWQAAQTDREATLRTAAEALGLDTAVPSPSGLTTQDPEADVVALAKKRLQDLAVRLSSMEGALALWRRFVEASTLRQSAEATAVKAEADRATAAEAWKRVNRLIKRSRQVRRAASDATRDLIKATFNDRLSGLVDDIYFRLVRDERFSPRMVPSGSGSQLTAAIHAFAEGEPVVTNAASVLSSANLNTAALSLFIALHLTSASQPKALVFDDPVQSMDDVHATNLASLLRSLAYHPTDPRQLVIATHDRALFDYLALELGPTKPGHKLLLQEVVRQDSRTVTVHPTPREWTPDGVTFGQVA